MPTPFENATLNLKLFDLRREAVLREGRQWFIAAEAIMAHRRSAAIAAAKARAAKPLPQTG